MPFLVLLILALAYLQTRWPEPPAWLTPLGSVLLTWLGVAVLAGVAGLMVRRFRRGLARQPHRYAQLMRRYFSCRRAHLVALVCFYFLATYLIGWGWTVKHCLTYGRWSVPGAELLILLPFLTGLFLSWARFYDMELAVQEMIAKKRQANLSPLAASEGTAVGDEGWSAADAEFQPTLSRWAYVGLQARQCLILAAPPFLLLLVQQILFSLFPSFQNDPLLMPLLSGGLLAVLFVGWPWLLRLLLNLKPLPDCPLRRQLDQTARRLSFRCTDIMVWDTHDTLATALLVGPLPVLRYVVLTDRLLQNMEPVEVEAVFGHEVGHVKHRHLLLYFMFMVLSLLALSALWGRLMDFVPPDGLDELVRAYVPWPEFWKANVEMLLAVPLLLALLAYLFVFFGLLSRRCERQADLYACRAVSGPAFIAALEKVAWLNGISRERPGWLSSWRHDTIARRVACVRGVQTDPRLELRHQHHIGLVKWALLVGLSCLLLILGPERLMEMFKQM